jgi:hypothetical protein
MSIFRRKIHDPVEEPRSFTSWAKVESAADEAVEVEVKSEDPKPAAGMTPSATEHHG